MFKPDDNHDGCRLAPVEQFDAHLSVNVHGVFLCYKHAALQMIKQGKGGRLIGKFRFQICSRISKFDYASSRRFINLW